MLIALPYAFSFFAAVKQLTIHLWKHDEILTELENGIKNSRKLETFCRDFELQKVCYLPLNTFLLRPLHRLMHYKQIMERLCKHYPPNHTDFRDSRGKQGIRHQFPELGNIRDACTNNFFCLTA